MMRMIHLSKQACQEVLKSIWKNHTSSASRPSSTAEILLKSNKKRISSLISTAGYQPILSNTAAAEENPRKRHKQRIKSSYSDNITAALELPCTAEELEELSDKALFEKSKPHIIEHASRRVDLFFYTLIAYYQTKMQPKQGHTHLQHGSGRNLLNNKNVTQGCHSSFLPTLVDKSTSSLGDEGLLSNTHFMDSLNSTVELPPYVNELDNELENTCFCRKKSLEILCKVDQGQINPIQGMTEFLLMMDKIFNEIEANNFRIEKFFCRYRKLTSELVKLSKHGTLTEKFSTVKKTVEPNYIESLLRLTADQKRAAKSSPAKRDKIYLAKIKEIQTEILSTKTQFSPSLS